MLIQHEQNDNRGSFYVEENNNRLAEMIYRMSDAAIMIIEHTEVADELRGKNVGYQLVHTAVEYARTNHLKILPLCSFAKAVFDKKHSEFGDVLK